MKYGFFLFCLYVIIVISGFTYLYFNLKQSTMNREKIAQEKFISTVSALIQETSQTLDMERFSQIFGVLIHTTPLEAINFKLKDYSFSDEILIARAKRINKGWKIVDVTTDVNYGEIVDSDDGRYKFVPHEDERFKGTVPVKFQAINDGKRNGWVLMKMKTTYFNIALMNLE